VNLYPEISVIIPTYNAEEYIERAVNSILAQSFDNIEIIVINDASGDKTTNILQERFGKELKVKFYNNATNYGQGISRNLGLEYAKGDYVFFLDSDDWIAPEALEKMYNIAKIKDADIVACGMQLVYQNGNTKTAHSHEFEVSGGLHALQMVADAKISISASDKLYRKDFIHRHALCFPSIYQEDIVFVLEAVYHCNKVISIPNLFYNYYQTAMSTSRGEISEKHIFSNIEMSRLINNFLSQINSDKNIDEIVAKIYTILNKEITYYMFKFYNNSSDNKRHHILSKVFTQHFGDRAFYVETLLETLMDQNMRLSACDVLKMFKQIKGRKIVFFGTGSASKNLTKFFPLSIGYYIDNNPDKWDEELNGIKICNPVRLLKENKNELAIIVASQYYTEISAQLQNMGFEENIHFWNGYEMYKHVL
jgi:glycosyltransferase involved in cell wall biosynthesis